MNNYHDDISTDRERRLLLTNMASLSVLPLMPLAAWAEGVDSAHKKIIALLQQETKLPADYIELAIGEARYDRSVIRRIKTPYEAKPYVQYRPLFVHEPLIRKGKAYLDAHQALFEKCRQQYGVQPQLIAAILGMETRYGNNAGRDRVLDALYTLAAGYPRRADFFRNELAEYLTLCFEEKIAPGEIKGSYAGAFGTTQFIPSSYRAYSVDADGDGKRDVWNSPADIIFSVGNYFHRYGWQQDRPVALWLDKLPYNVLTARLLKEETRSWVKLAELQPYLPPLSDAWQAEDKVTLIRRRTKRGRRSALVHYNFHVITRWNRSYNYALVAAELAYRMGCPLCDIGA